MRLLLLASLLIAILMVRKKYSVHCYCLVTKSCPNLLWPLGLLCLGSVLERILEWVAISFFRGSSRPRDLTHVSYFGRWILLTLNHQGNPVMSNLVVVQSLHCVRLFVTPWTAACQASLSFTISLSLLRLMSNQLILCHPLLLLSIFPNIRVFSKEPAFPWYQVAKVLEL